MSGFYRLLYVATGGCLVVLVATLGWWLQANKCIQSGLWPAETYRQATERRAGQHQNNRVIEPSGGGVSERAIGDLTCNYCQDTAETKKAQHDEDDLIAQEVSARSSICMTILSLGQMLAGVVGLIFLGFTLKYTRDTAEAGRASARAAQNIAQDSQRDFERLERPYLFIDPGPCFMIKSIDSGPYAEFSLANYGKTPGIIERVFAEILVSPIAGPDRAMPRERYQHAFLSRPHVGLKEITSTVREPFPNDLAYTTADGRIIPNYEDWQQVFFWVVIQYRGLFTRGHETSMCYTMDELTGALVQFGGEKYNYVK